MISNPFQPIAANERLRQRLDDFYSCMEDCLRCLRVQGAFSEVCDALSKEMDDVLAELGSLEEQYQEELPLDSEEPKGVVWVAESEKMLDYRNELLSHGFAADDDFVRSLSKRLTIASEVMNRIDGQLYTEDDPDIYTSYCKRELKDYAMSRWNRPFRDIRNSIATAPSNHRNEYISEKLDVVMQGIHEVSDYIINPDSSVIFYEALGRYLWQLRHEDCPSRTVDEVLCLIQTAEYYCNRLQRKFIYLDRETSPEEEQNELVQQERVKQETLQTQLGIASMRLCFCKGYFANDFTEGFVGKMLHDLINSEHCAKVCDKMSNRKIRKFIHQIAGVLKDQRVFEECSYGDLADDMKFPKPRRDSRIDYIRHMVDDVPEIQEWLVAYIANYREQLRRQAQ